MLSVMLNTLALAYVIAFNGMAPMRHIFSIRRKGILTTMYPKEER
jgi:hypothetical protein